MTGVSMIAGEHRAQSVRMDGAGAIVVKKEW